MIKKSIMEKTLNYISDYISSTYKVKPHMTKTQIPQKWHYTNIIV